ncbi:MAG TPA: hypothetical protein VFZ53_23445 [Polyangiaceae bacterium]
MDSGSKKQEPRPRYHRRQDLKRLQEYAVTLPILIGDLGHAYAAYPLDTRPDAPLVPLFSGRYEVVHAYISGQRDARERIRILEAAERAGFRCQTCGQPIGPPKG